MKLLYGENRGLERFLYYIFLLYSGRSYIYLSTEQAGGWWLAAKNNSQGTSGIMRVTLGNFGGGDAAKELEETRTGAKTTAVVKNIISHLFFAF